MTDDCRRRGSLIVVGTGIKLASQCTPEAQRAIEEADIVLAMVDPVALRWLEGLNTRVVSMQSLYRPGRARSETYAEMTEAILAAVRAGQKVCAAFYGHPGVFVLPSRAAIARAREEGFDALMLPGVSAEDCLFADLGVDPGAGWQSYEAHDYFVHARTIDPSAGLVLWQLAVFGDERFTQLGPNSARLHLLAQALMETYPEQHEVVVYEAATLPIGAARVQRTPLCRLHEAELTQHSTLYVPPAATVRPSPERLAMLRLAT